MHRLDSDGHSLSLRVPQRTYIPCAPFQTRRAVSAYGRMAAIETQRIEPGKNHHQLIPPVFDYAEEHAAQLDAAEERRREARLVRKEIEKRRQQQQSQSEAQEGGVRRIPMLIDQPNAFEMNQKSTVLPAHLSSHRGDDVANCNKRRPRQTMQCSAPTSWELLRSIDEQGGGIEGDASYWVSRKYTAAGVCGFDDLAAGTLRDGHCAPQKVSEENEEGAAGEARELLESILYSAPLATADGGAFSTLAGEREAGPQEIASLGRDADQLQTSASQINPLDTAKSIPQLLIAASNRDAIMSSPVASDWQSYFAQYRVTEQDLDAINHVIRHPIRVLLCDGNDGSSMKERFVTFEVLRISSNVDPSRMFQPQQREAFLSLRSGRSEEFPVLERYGLRHLVDVTIGAGFSVNFLPHMRSAKHVKERGAAHLQLSKKAEDTMRREVTQFSKAEKPKSMPSVKSNAETRKAFQLRMDDYCKKLEEAFPFFIGPAKSFLERNVYSSRNCFSCWLLFPDGQKADSLDFVAVDEDESLLLVDVLRMLVRLNQPLPSNTLVGASGAGTSEKGKGAEGKAAHVSALSLAERRWLCHALCYERPAPPSQSVPNGHNLQSDLAVRLSQAQPISSLRQKGHGPPPPDLI